VHRPHCVTRHLYILHDPPLDGPTNMARDEHLLYSGTWRPAVLRFYTWTPPTLSLGYFQRYAELATLPPEVRALPVVRRITGGGAILHDRELTYCLVLDATVPIARQPPLALYELVHECWRQAVGRDCPAIATAPPDLPLPTPRTGPFFCFQKPGRTDLLVEGRKVLGSAQRRLRDRVLQHGSLLLGRRFEAHPGAHLGEPPAQRVAEWQTAFTDRLAAALNLTACSASWEAGQLEDVARRRERYAGDAWTRQF